MSSPRDTTDEEIDAELAKAEQKMKEELAEKRRVAQERKAALKKAKEEKARKVEEARLKAEAEEKAKAEADRLAKEAQEKAEAERKEREAREKDERVHRENRRRLYRELIEYKERTEAKAKRKAEEREKHQADKGMMLATPADISAIDRARQINAENAKNRAEGFKPPWGGSSKAPATPQPKPTTLVNLTRQVQNEEAMRKSGKLGKTGEVAVSVLFCFILAFLTWFLFRLSVATCV
jgi:membrane protein involved in colicin uptake